MTKPLKKLIIIDGNAIIHRSFHALPPTLTTKSGQIVNAVYGFTLFLLKAITELKPQYIVLTLDKKGPTFRHEEYKEYKAQRVKAPDELYDQIPIVKQVAEAFDIPIFELSGFEADDLIGTITRQVNDRVEKIIMTGDMDTMQLINSHTKVYTMSRGISESVLYDESGVQERYGLKPDQMVDYKALRGDPSDNIPGVKGIGEKTASDLLHDFKTLDGVYQAVNKNNQKIKPRILELLQTFKDNAYLSQKLARIDCAAPIKFDLAAAAFNKLDKDKIIKLFSELEFKSLVPRLASLDNYTGKRPEKNEEDNHINDKFARDQKKFKYILVDDDQKFNTFLKKLAIQKIFTIDTETTSLDPLTTKLLGISFSWKEGEAYFLPIKTHESNTPSLFSTPTNNQSWLKKLQPILKDPKIKKCGHNIKFDLRVLVNQGLEINGIYFDTMIASYLLHPENRQHNLDALTFSELNFEKINHVDLLGAGRDKIEFGTVPLEKLAIYSCEDADFTNRLVEILDKELHSEKLWELFTKIEMPLIPVLAQMEDNGILIDKSLLGKMGKELSREIKILEQKIYKAAGLKFNINSTKQLKEVLYEKLQIATKGIKKTKTGLSTAADELEKLKKAHPIIPLIQNYRELAKLISTYIEALPVLINPKTGRLHTSFNQTITATGRLSSTEPNLQNIPTRTDLGKKIREAFIAKKGYELVSLDYSQIELRLAAHMSGDKKMIAAFKNGVDIHATTAADINGVKLEKVTSAMRREAKAVNFGVIYGQGPHGLSLGAGIPYTQAKEFIDTYFKIYTGISKFIETTLATAKKLGYVETLFGRRRYLPEINSHIFMLAKSAERMAVNMPFQGTAADMIKLAMIEVEDLVKNKDDIKMLLQVHDELLFEIKKDQVDYYTKKIKAIMEGVIELKVPVVVDVAIGKNWGEIK